jgi:hypothetical protein
MSIGVFLTIGASYVERAKDVGQRYVAAIDRALRSRGLPGYADPPRAPDAYRRGRFGRSSLDHHGAGTFVSLGEMAEEDEASPHLSLLAESPFRLAFVPTDFELPMPVEHSELIAGERPRLWLGSSPRLLEELYRMAPRLGIPLEDGSLSDELARRIDARELLTEGDDGALADDERTGWLLLVEGARLSIEHRVALALAG